MHPQISPYTCFPGTFEGKCAFLDVWGWGPLKDPCMSLRCFVDAQVVGWALRPPDSMLSKRKVLRTWHLIGKKKNQVGVEWPLLSLEFLNKAEIHPLVLWIDLHISDNPGLETKCSSARLGLQNNEWLCIYLLGLIAWQYTANFVN